MPGGFAQGLHQRHAPYAYAHVLLEIERTPNTVLRESTQLLALRQAMSSALGLFSLVSSAWAALLQGQMPEPEIIKTLISKLLGYGILAGSLGVKVPQVKNILQNKSAEGLSALSAELELIGLAIHASYGYLKGLAFNTYGEVVIVGVQSAFILGLIYHYSKASSFRRLFMSSACIGLLSVVVSATGDKGGGQLQRLLF
eukprot:gene878-5708_t